MYSSSYFRYGVTLSRWRTWRHFTQKSAASWWMHTHCLPGAYAASCASSWSIVHSYSLDQELGCTLRLTSLCIRHCARTLYIFITDQRSPADKTRNTDRLIMLLLHAMCYITSRLYWLWSNDKLLFKSFSRRRDKRWDKQHFYSASESLILLSVDL